MYARDDDESNRTYCFVHNDMTFKQHNMSSLHKYRYLSSKAAYPYFMHILFDTQCGRYLRCIFMDFFNQKSSKSKTIYLPRDLHGLALHWFEVCRGDNPLRALESKLT